MSCLKIQCTLLFTISVFRISLYLRSKRADPDGDKDDVSIETLEDVSLSVNLACVDFVKERHHYKRVENHSEMLCRLRVKTSTGSRVNVQQLVTCITIYANNNTIIIK